MFVGRFERQMEYLQKLIILINVQNLTQVSAPLIPSSHYFPDHSSFFSLHPSVILHISLTHHSSLTFYLSLPLYPSYPFIFP